MSPGIKAASVLLDVAPMQARLLNFRAVQGAPDQPVPVTVDLATAFEKLKPN